MSDDDVTAFRDGGISYLQIPAEDPAEAAAFYAAVFGWRVHGGSDRPGFEDRSGLVIGHFMRDSQVAGEAGVRPYISVESVGDTVEKLTALGGEVVTAPYPEGSLTVATFRDPAGNVIGIWQR